MWKFENIKTDTIGAGPQYPAVKDYIKKKNVNFIILRGQCENRCYTDLDRGELDCLLDEFADCDVSMISWPGATPSPPFLAADIDPATRTAKVVFLLDLTREAEDGQASPFYSKLMGALATQFLAGRRDVDRLWFPFSIRDTVGKGIMRKNKGTGTMLARYEAVK